MLSENIGVNITLHAQQRLEERSDHIGTPFEDMVRQAKRTGIWSKDGLRVYQYVEGLYFLVLEKHAITLGGLYEVEVITVYNQEMFEHMDKRGKPE